MARIFISYRRTDSAAMSRRIYDALAKRVGEKGVFRDVDSLLKGEDFRAGIERYIFQSSVMLVLIGDQWLDIRDTKTGERRLDNPEDFVRIEVDMGLRHVRKVIPVLVNGASMPNEAELPVRLSPLAFKNAVQVRDESFDTDFEILLRAIGTRNRFWWMARIGALFVVLAVAAWIALNGNSPPATSTPSATDEPTTVSQLDSTSEVPTIDLDATIAARQAEFTVTAVAQQTTNAAATATASSPTPTEDFEATISAALTATQQVVEIEWAQNFSGGNANWTPIEQDIDDVPMVLVPAGCFDMGNGAGGRQCFEEPFWMDKYEVTNAEYARFVAAGGYNNPEYWTEAGWQWRQANNITAPRDYEGFTEPDQPRVGVSWYEAVAYANWRGGKLPTEAEWEYAARGPNGWVYPWGNEWNGDNLVWSDNSSNRTANVGSRPAGASWVGALDMSGNVWEWVSSQYRDYPYAADDGREDLQGTTNRVLRGGSFDSNQYSAAASSRFSFDPRGGDYGFGLRLVLAAPIAPLDS